MTDQKITSDPAVMMGKPVLEGTRLTVEQILEELGAGDTMKSERQPSDFHGLSEKGSNLSESDRLGGGSPFATCSHCGRETLRAYLVNIEPGDIACSPVWVCRKCAEGYGWYSQGGAWHHNELRPYGEGSDD